MNLEDFIAKNKSAGLNFIKSVLAYEQQRFDKSFIKNSAFEDINSNFGIFPAVKVYPVYFIGDITKPAGKTIFIGINPGYNPEANKKEQAWMEKDYFYSCCHLFDFFASQRPGLLTYFANIAGFLKRLKGIEAINWQWLQDNLVCLETIPYHSSNASGLRINDLPYYRKTYFEILLRMLDYLKPKEPIFINGFATFENYFGSEIFQDVISFKKRSLIWTGKIKGWSFIGLPFLNRPRGGKDKLADLSRRQL